MTSAADTDPSPTDIRTDYLAQMRQKRLLNMILLLIFATLMVAGFYTADQRNAAWVLERLAAHPGFSRGRGWRSL